MKTMKINQSIILAAVTSAIAGQSASAATFVFQTANPSFFEGRWGITDYWAIQAGTGDDDGTPNIPDGLDTVIIDRNPNPVNDTKLVLDGGGTPNPLTVAGITATGASGIDIQIKTFDLIVGDLEVLPSAETLIIDNERDKDLIITGVLSGSGDLELSRGGGFSDEVTSDEVFLLGGTSPNTITGKIRLFNSNNNADNPQPSYWVADKVGAFGQAAELVLEGRPGFGGIASLQFTANTTGGEGAIDDDATTFFIGAKGVLNIDAGVNEGVGEGKLLIDLAGTGIYTEVPVGTYDNTEDWIIGDGTFTVGASSAPLAITSISYADTPTTVSLTWNSRPGQGYDIAYSTDMINWESKLTPDAVGSAGETTTQEFDLSTVAALAGETKIFFRVEEK